MNSRAHRVILAGIEGTLVTLFMLLLWFPLLDSLIELDPCFDLQENRSLARQPALSLDKKALCEYPRKFEDYYDDHFGFRKSLIYWHSLVTVIGLDVTPSSARVVKGKGRWLFFAGDRSVDNYRNTEPFTAEQLATWQRVLEDRRDWFAEQGIRYLFVIAPDKQTIYPECMPDWITRVGSRSRLDQFVEYLAAHSDVPILDLRGPLLEARKQQRVFHYTDTHWNDFGAYVAYREILQRLSEWFPQLRPLPLSSFAVVREEGPGRDLANSLALGEILREDVVQLVPMFDRVSRRVAPDLNLGYMRKTTTLAKECANPRLPRAIIFYDSFAEAVEPFLSEHFRRTLCHQGPFQYVDAISEIIEHEKPDVVIDEMVERLAVRTQPANPLEVAGRPFAAPYRIYSARAFQGAGQDGTASIRILSESSSISAVCAFPGGETRMALYAVGSPCDGRWPLVEISVNRSPIGRLEISSRSGSYYYLNSTVDQGEHRVEIKLLRNGRNESRNERLSVAVVRFVVKEEAVAISDREARAQNKATQ